MKPIYNPIHYLRDGNGLVRNIFFICSSIALVTLTVVTIMKLISNHCCCHYDISEGCNCGCQDNIE